MKSNIRKSLAALALLLCLGASAPGARADELPEYGFGLGAVLGEPSGISASLPLGSNSALNFLVGTHLSRGKDLTLLADYVWHQRDLIPVETGKVSVYYGPRGRVMVAAQSEVSAHALVGIDYLFAGAPVQIFVEAAPGLNIVPNTNPTGTAGLGARFFF